MAPRRHKCQDHNCRLEGGGGVSRPSMCCPFWILWDNGRVFWDIGRLVLHATALFVCPGCEAVYNVLYTVYIMGDSVSDISAGDLDDLRSVGADMNSWLRNLRTANLTGKLHRRSSRNKEQGRREWGETGATAPGPKCTSLKWNRLLRLYLLSEAQSVKLIIWF